MILMLLYHLLGMLEVVICSFSERFTDCFLVKRSGRVELSHDAHTSSCHSVGYKVNLLYDDMHLNVETLENDSINRVIQVRNSGVESNDLQNSKAFTVGNAAALHDPMNYDLNIIQVIVIGGLIRCCSVLINMCVHFMENVLEDHSNRVHRLQRFVIAQCLGCKDGTLNMVWLYFDCEGYITGSLNQQRMLFRHLHALATQRVTYFVDVFVNMGADCDASE